MNLDLLIWHLQLSEGYKNKPYLCPAKKLTIGYGRNLQDNGISKDEADLMLKNDVLNVKLELEDRLSFFGDLDDVRQNVLVEMGYNMGVPNLLKFKKTLQFIKEQDYESASEEMLNSKWHRDFIEYAPNTHISALRSSRLSKILREGAY